VKISSDGEQSVSSDEAENVSDNSSMQPDIWGNSGAEHLLENVALMLI
jgi:hypothetical protein